MERDGWRVLRFWANHVVQDRESIWAEIEQVVLTPHLTSPLKGRGT
jgi:very-short-patch-repair endonuclease